MATLLIKLSEIIFSKRVTLSLLNSVEAYLNYKLNSISIIKMDYFHKNFTEVK